MGKSNYTSYIKIGYWQYLLNHKGTDNLFLICKILQNSILFRWNFGIYSDSMFFNFSHFVSCGFIWDVVELYPVLQESNQ